MVIQQSLRDTSYEDMLNPRRVVANTQDNRNSDGNNSKHRRRAAPLLASSHQRQNGSWYFVCETERAVFVRQYYHTIPTQSPSQRRPFIHHSIRELQYSIPLTMVGKVR